MNEENHVFMSGGKTPEVSDKEIQQLVRARIENLRPKLLDLTRRNPLISTRFSPRSNSYIRVVDELPDVLQFHLLAEEEAMRFIPLPRLEEDPADEQTLEFQDALTNARLTDEDYLAAVDKIDPDNEYALEQNQRLERELRDRVRKRLAMPPRQTKTEVSLAQHASNNGIRPSYELPKPTEEHEDGRHSDADIQTLLLPDDLERKLNGLSTKCRTWIQETGINVLHAAFGFLEWTEQNGKDSFLAPLVLAAVDIKKQKTRQGLEFWVQTTGDKAETNIVLAEKLRLDFGIDLPKYEGGSIEDYLAEVAGASPRSLTWKVRRRVAFGVFPSARMAMYHDLDPSRPSDDQNGIVQSLLGGSPASDMNLFADDYEIDRPEVEAKVPYLVLDADCSQFSVVADVADGQNLAVEGPPGTGKSQTIVNAIAAAIADGKKVLFVAEKTAALNVVRSRLEAVKLGEFILPLQAEASSREKVIQSVRDRVSMEASQTPKDYNRKKKEFQHTRSELASYIAVLSSHFGQAGLTVHDILGKSIATSDVLLGKPKALLSPDLRDITAYDQPRIDSLRELGEDVSGAWQAASAAEEYWRGLGIYPINRFLAEQICDCAEAAAVAYQSSAQARQQLVPLAIDPGSGLPDLESLKETLDVLQPRTFTDVDLISRVCRENQFETVIDFITGCERLQTLQQELSQVFTDASDQSWPERLRTIGKLCQSSDFDTLDTKTLQLNLARETEVLARQERAYEKLKQFFELLPEGASFGIPEIIKARKLVDETPRDVLALRNEGTAHPAAAVIMARAAQQGRDLCRRREELESIISPATDLSINDLSTHRNAIVNAGLLRFFSSSYRLARHTYLSISHRGSFKKQLAIQDIQALVEWKKSERDFLTDQGSATVFGLHFQGMDTDFDLFERLQSYYEDVEREFSGIEHREIRGFLKTGDFDLLMSIPEIGEEIDQKTLDELGSHLERVGLYLSNSRHALEQLMPLIDGLKEPARIRVSTLASLAQQADAHLRLKASLDENQEMRNLLGDHFGGASTDWKELETDIAAVQTIMSATPHLDVVLDILEKGVIDEALTVIETVIQRDSNATAALSDLSQRTDIDTIHFSNDRTHAEIAEYLGAAAQDKDGLDVHSAYAAALHDLEKAGFDWVIAALLEEGLPLDDLGALLEAVVMRALVIEVYNMHGRTLGRFSGEKLDELRARLAAADREITKISREHLRSQVYQSADPPPGNGRGRKSTWTERSLIDNELSKKRRFIPVRDLTQRAGSALLELKPCWMMSPLAVAQYLPRVGVNFDLCIIDEASQMPPEDAIGALARSRQAVVVGDTNQLPPTSFFRKLVEDEDADEDEAVLEESILEMANAAFRPPRRLRWHYRSRHSALINFSNHLIYDDDLIVFPSANESTGDMGVSLEPVPGLYSSGTNAKEARAMIDATLHFMRTKPDCSLGLVTLNQKQRDLLLEEWDYAVSRDKTASQYVDDWTKRNDGLESFFIKNLENVQGDERDVIFIGTVYGPEKPNGPVLQRFGPINGLAGKRRLNVLFSRAKKQIVTFSSMTAADIRADENGNPGAYMLKRWLEYSVTGMLHTGGQTSREPDSDFEIFVINQIKSMGCEPVPQVGVAGYFIDIGVKHPHWPHGFILGVECDGAAYHSSKSARDRDRLRQEVLEGLGWHFHRIWSTDWFNDPRKEAEKLRRVIESRLDDLKQKRADSFVVPGAATPHPGISPQEETEEDILSDVEKATSTTAPLDSTPAADVPEPEAQLDDTNPDTVAVGDTVRVRYLSSTEPIEITLSDKTNAPDRGIVRIDRPIGRALLGAEEGDEIDILIGSYVRQAVIERVIKGDQARITQPSSTTNPPHAPAEDHLAQGQTGLFHERSQSPGSNTKSGLNPDRFYEPSYHRVIRACGVELIDALGPMTFDHLSEKIARAHGFRRTGRQIKKQVRAAISKVRRSTRTPDDKEVFWPDSLEPKKSILFRGLIVAGDERSWHDVPYPEKLGLAHEILVHSPRTEAVVAMAAKIGLGHLRKKTREELEALLEAAKTRIGTDE